MRFLNRDSSPRKKKGEKMENEEQSQTQVGEELETTEAEGQAQPQNEANDKLLQQLTDDLKRLAAERDEYQSQALRAIADFQNLRRRTQQEALTIRQYATENFVSDLLPVLDNFERTVDHIEAGATLESLLEGVRAVERQLRNVLEAQNLKRIESLGQPFDPNVHEAIGVVEMDGQDPDTVVEEVMPGYRLGDKIIRPARVRLSAS